MKRIFSLLAVSAAGLALGGCGLNDPYNDQPASEPASATATPAGGDHAEAGHDEGSHDETVKDTSDPSTALSENAPDDADAEEVAVAYGLAQTNWSYATYEKQYERMKRLAGGELGKDLAASAPERDQLEGIKENQQVNRSQVVAVDTRKASPAQAVIVVVFRETAGSGGALDPVPHHTVHQATVRKLNDEWRVVDWLSLQS